MILIAIVGDEKDRDLFINAIAEKYFEGSDKSRKIVPGLSVASVKIKDQDIQLRFIADTGRYMDLIKKQLAKADAIIHVSPEPSEIVKPLLNEHASKVFQLTKETSLDDLFSKILTTYKPKPADIIEQYEKGFWGKSAEKSDVSKDEALLNYLKKITELPESSPEVRSKTILYELKTITRLSVNTQEKGRLAREKMLDFYTKLTKEDADDLIPKLEQLKNDSHYSFLKQPVASHTGVKTTLELIIDTIKEVTKVAIISPRPRS